MVRHGIASPPRLPTFSSFVISVQCALCTASPPPPNKVAQYLAWSCGRMVVQERNEIRHDAVIPICYVGTRFLCRRRPFSLLPCCPWRCYCNYYARGMCLIRCQVDSYLFFFPVVPIVKSSYRNLDQLSEPTGP